MDSLAELWVVLLKECQFQTTVVLVVAVLKPGTDLLNLQHNWDWRNNSDVIVMFKIQQTFLLHKDWRNNNDAIVRSKYDFQSLSSGTTGTDARTKTSSAHSKCVTVITVIYRQGMTSLRLKKQTKNFTVLSCYDVIATFKMRHNFLFTMLT